MMNKECIMVKLNLVNLMGEDYGMIILTLIQNSLKVYSKMDKLLRVEL